MKKGQVFWLSLWLSVYVLWFLIMAAEVIKGVLIGDWSKMIFPFLLFFILIRAVVKSLAKLSDKKVFIIFKDKDW